MKTKALIMLLLMAVWLALVASEGTNDAEVQWQKTQELNRLADRFKLETGFKGRINYGYERMRLGSFEGNFTDIPFSPDADTLAFRQACERIIDKILPYSSAKRSQLSQGKISSQWGRTTTDYRQQVNGYRVEGSGFIMITYEAGRKYFSIGDNTVELPEVAQVNITREKAIDTAIGFHKGKVNPPEHKLVPYVIDDLRFYNPNKSYYSLKYIIYLGDFVYYIDTTTGRLDWDNAPGDFLSEFVIKGKVSGIPPFFNPALF